MAMTSHPSRPRARDAGSRAHRAAPPSDEGQLDRAGRALGSVFGEPAPRRAAHSGALAKALDALLGRRKP